MRATAASARLHSPLPRLRRRQETMKKKKEQLAGLERKTKSRPPLSLLLFFPTQRMSSKGRKGGWVWSERHRGHRKEKIGGGERRKEGEDEGRGKKRGG
mmetsp:Transcript_30495/g.59913  ORF Transcript_30495/g.59913 Transcript_30495/m.59913 type:complete len:99 (-) Transcript_30495:962-1258(-)